MYREDWILFAAILAIVLLLVGLACIPLFWHYHIPDHGIVVRKQFTPLHTNYIYISDGKSGGHMTPLVVPEQWGIVVQEDGTTGDEGQFYFPISQQRYNSLKTGDVWNRVQAEQ